MGIGRDGVIPEGVEAQAHLCFRAIAAILGEAGMAIADIVRLNAYVTAAEHLGGYMRVARSIRGRPPPASTLMIVSGFARPEFKVEVEAIAARAAEGGAGMGPSKLWSDWSWRDFAAADMSKVVAVLPVAATEQHGPHLPVGVDTFINQGYLERAVKLTPDDMPVLYLPVQAIGKSNEHIEFPGTLTFSHETVIRAWTEIGDSVARARAAASSSSSIRTAAMCRSSTSSRANCGSSIACSPCTRPGIGSACRRACSPPRSGRTASTAARSRLR